MIRARSAVIAGALLAAGAVPPDLDASDEAPAPIVVHADRWEPPDVPEAVILVARLLQREGIEPPPSDAARRTLAREIAAVLSRIRGEYPEVADVVARETYERPGGVILTVEPELLGSVSRLLGDRDAPVTLRTGHVRFDALNAALGLHFMHYNFCRLHQTLRVPPAMEAGVTEHLWEIGDLIRLIDDERDLIRLIDDEREEERNDDGL